MGRSKAPSLPIKALSFCRPTELRGKGGGASHQRGDLPRPPGRLYGFRRQRRYKKWRRRRRTSPAQRYYITPEGESPQPACKAKPITGRTLAAQGQRPGGWLNPHARKGVSTFGNTGKHRYDPQHPLRSDRLMSLCSREYGPESAVSGQRIADGLPLHPMVCHLPADLYLPVFPHLLFLPRSFAFVETLQRVSKSAEVGP